MDDLYVGGMIATMCATPGTPLTGRDPQQATAALAGRGPERLVDLGIRLGPWGDDLGRRPGGLTLEEVRGIPTVFGWPNSPVADSTRSCAPPPAQSSWFINV